MKRKRVLGSGAFGQVLLMEAGKGNGKELLAVKILHSGAMDLDGLRLFLSEAK